MANVNYPGHLVSANEAGLTEAQYIAYTTRTETDNDGDQRLVMTKSVAQKINEIEQSMSDTQQIENIVDQKINQLEIPSTQDLNTATTNAQNAATQAQGYSADASTNSNNAKTAFNKIHYGYFVDGSKNVVAVPDDNGAFHGTGIYQGRDPFAYNGGYAIRDNNSQLVICYFVKSVNEYTDQLDRISEVAESFATGFNADAQFVILSETEYNNLANKSDNTIYFIY